MTASSLAPVIVVSPAPRAGTTLLQRLLCSAPNTLIYGDVVGQEMDFLGKYASARLHMMGHHEFIAGPQRDAVRAGNVDDFITSLAPTPQTQAAQWQAAAHAWVQGCYEEALSQGKSVWGWKLAGIDGHAVDSLATWFPQARWIWLERDVQDCFRSALGVGLVQSEADAVPFRQQAENAAILWSAAMEKQGCAVLRLSYSGMLAAPEATVLAVEQFTGASGIQRSVFAKKIGQSTLNTN